jgi:hypothetical protein
MNEQQRIGRLLDIVVGATVAFLPFVALRLLDEDNFSTEVVLLAITLTALIIVNEWWWLTGTLSEQVPRGAYPFYFFVVAYIFGLVSLPLALAAVSDNANTFAYFGGILMVLSLIDGALSLIAGLNAQGRQRRSLIFNTGFDALLAFLYGVLYIVFVQPELAPWLQVVALMGFYAFDFAVGTWFVGLVVGNGREP